MSEHSNGTDAAQGAAEMLALKAMADDMWARARDGEQDWSGSSDYGATATAIPPYSPINLQTLSGMDIPPISYTVDGLFPAGSLILLAGREKSGKSLLFIDAACSIAAGEHLFGRMTTPGPIIFCPAEDSIRTIRDRIDTRLMDRTLLDGRPFWLLPISGVEMGAGVVEGVRLNLLDPLSIARFAGMIRQLGPAAVFIDTLRETHDARENEADDMAPVIRPLRNLAHETGTTIVIAHHASKSGGSRGSTAIAAGCDVVAQWTADDEDGAEDSVLLGTLMAKGRDVPKTTIRLRMTDTLRFHPVDMPAGATAPTLKGRILSALSEYGPMSAAQIADRTKLVLGSVKNTCNHMVANNRPMIEVASGHGTKNDPRIYRCVIRHDPLDTPASLLRAPLPIVTNRDELRDAIIEGDFRDALGF